MRYREASEASNELVPDPGRKRVAHPPSTVRPALTAQGVLQLQAVAGNRAVNRLLKAAQAKLTVGAVNEAHEREADAVGHDVANGLTRGSFGPHGFVTVQGQPEPPTVRRRAAIGVEGSTLDETMERSLRTARAGGRPLAPGLRHSMEAALGHDLSAVRLHTGPEANQLSRSMQAQAFTIGSDIFFGDGAPRTNERQGRELLAHEVVHTVQQEPRPLTGTADAGSGRGKPVPHVQRMKIKGVGSKAKKKTAEYKPGSFPNFKQDYKTTKGSGLALAAIGMSEDDFKLLFDNMAKGGDAEFDGIDQFLQEVQTLRDHWGGQKLFYEESKLYGDVQGQHASGKVRLYSARPAADVQNLYGWATQNNIPTQGFNAIALPANPVPAPLHGHFADRSHTVKHKRQKAASGGALICLVLNAGGSDELRRLKADPGNIVAKGGEGERRGTFGLKHEGGFISVALGQSRETWDFLKDKIELVELA